MAMRFPVAGANSTAIGTATEAIYSVLGRNLPTNRSFWLRWIYWTPSGTGGYLNIYDATSGATGPASSTLKLILPSATSADDGWETLNSGYREFAAPGMRFASGCCARLDASGSISIGGVAAGGYEE